MASSPSEFPIFVSALTTGLVGGFAHCIGMCGIFVVSYTGLPAKDENHRFLHPERHFMFHSGRLLSLSLLGLVAGAVGSLAGGQLSHGWGMIQGLLSLVAGTVMFALALGFAGVLPRLRVPEPDILGAGGGRLRRAFLRVLQSKHGLKPLLIGLFVGLLPCGLTYIVLAGAFALHPVSAALMMFLFGLGTVPGLLALGLFGSALFGGLLTNTRFRERMTQIAALLMAGLGLVFIWRAWSTL